MTSPVPEPPDGNGKGAIGLRAVTKRYGAERVVDHLYERVIQAFGVLFVAVLLIVLASRLLGALLARRAARRTSAGGKVD